MVRGLKKTGDVLARSDLVPPARRARGGGILRDRPEATAARSGRRARGAVRVEPARVGGPPVAVRDHPEPRAATRSAADQADTAGARGPGRRRGDVGRSGAMTKRRASGVDEDPRRRFSTRPGERGLEQDDGPLVERRRLCMEAPLGVEPREGDQERGEIEVRGAQRALGGRQRLPVEGLGLLRAGAGRPRGPPGRSGSSPGARRRAGSGRRGPIASSS